MARLKLAKSESEAVSIPKPSNASQNKAPEGNFQVVGGPHAIFGVLYKLGTRLYILAFFPPIGLIGTGDSD